MSDNETPETNSEDDDDSRYKTVTGRLESIEKKQAAHDGVLGELKEMLGGFLASASKPAATPSNPDASAEVRPAKKAKRKWL